jgi:hypothetical protein
MNHSWAVWNIKKQQTSPGTYSIPPLHFSSVCCWFFFLEKFGKIPLIFIYLSGLQDLQNTSKIHVNCNYQKCNLVQHHLLDTEKIVIIVFNRTYFLFLNSKLSSYHAFRKGSKTTNPSLLEVVFFFF